MAESPQTPTPQNGQPGPPALPDVDELIARTQQFVAQTITQTLKDPVSEVGTWLGRRVLGFALAVVLLSCAAGFLLFGFMFMLSQWIPTYGACLLVGVVALLMGLFFMKSS